MILIILLIADSICLYEAIHLCPDTSTVEDTHRQSSENFSTNRREFVVALITTQATLSIISHQIALTLKKLLTCQ